MSLLFTGFIAVSLLLFLKTFTTLQLNTELLTKSGVVPAFLFMVPPTQGMLAAILSLYVQFWAWGNLMDTIRVLAILVFPFLFAARMGLAAVAKARAEATKKAS